MRYRFLIPLLLPMAALAAADSPLIVIDATKEKPIATPAVTPAPTAVTTGTAATSAKKTPTTTPAAAPIPPAQAMMDDFPVWAVSKAGSDTTGQTAQAPAPPPAPASPTAPAVPATPTAPKAPPAPSSPTDKLWPRDTVPIFVRSCTGLHVELLAPCTCVITKLMPAMPHNEFLELSAAGTLDNDKRIVDIRKGCLGTPGKRKE